MGGGVMGEGLGGLLVVLRALFIGSRGWLDCLRREVMGAFSVFGLPWYVLCFLRNGQPFVNKFFWEHQVGRFSTEELAHGQPFWFFLPVIVLALFPWIPAMALLFRRSLYSDSRRRVLLLWVVFGLVFSSV